MNSRKIGVIGLGYVGGAVRHWFEKKFRPRPKLFLYDKFKKIGSLEEVNRADVVFVAVPTPHRARGGYDDSALWESLKGLHGRKVVVLKSTILPGSTEKFQKAFPRHAILFNPEFLRAKTANADFVRPDRQVVGWTRKSRAWARRILGILPRAPFVRVMPATEAELVKYFGNAFLATRVIFGNQLYDLARKLGADYDRVREAAGADPRVGTSHFTVFHEEGRGYTGGCLPKDVKSLVDFAEKKGVDFPLLKTVDRLNEKLRKK